MMIGKGVGAVRNRDRLWFRLILAVTFIGILALNLFTPLLADDYLYAFSFATGERIASVGDIFPSLATHAVSMNGRLTPHFFVQLFVMLPRWIFAIINSFVYLALLLGIIRLAARKSERFPWQLLLIVNGAVFLLPPAFGQSFLWLAGSVNYLWCDTLLVWLLVPFADFYLRGKSLSGAGNIALLSLGALVMGNMSENVSAAAILMMGLCVLGQWVRRQKAPKWMLVVTLAAFVGWLLLMLAPANRMNVSRAAGGLNALATNYQAALSMWVQHGIWPSIAYGIAFFIALADQKADRSRLGFSVGLFLCSLACNFAMTASSYYPERAYTGSLLFVILAFAVVLGACEGRLWQKALIPSLACMLGLVMALELIGAVPSAYNRQRLAQARITEVCADRDAGQTDIITFGVKGNSRFDAFYGLHELTDDPKYFPNVYFARYYGLNSVVVDRFE